MESTTWETLLGWWEGSRESFFLCQSTLFNNFQHYSTFFRGWPAKTKKNSLPTKDHKIIFSGHFWLIRRISKKSGEKSGSFFPFLSNFFSTPWEKNPCFHGVETGAHNLINAYDGQQSTHFSWWTMININAWWTMINNKVGKWSTAEHYDGFWPTREANIRK